MLNLSALCRNEPYVPAGRAHPPGGRRHRQLKRGAIRAACQRSTSKSLTAATASIQMDLAFVGGEGEQTKDLNRVLLAPLPDATIGRISSGRKRDYGAMFRERSERPVGTTQKDAIQKSFFGFSEGFLPPPRCPRRSFAVARGDIHFG